MWWTFGHCNIGADNELKPWPYVFYFISLSLSVLVHSIDACQMPRYCYNQKKTSWHVQQLIDSRTHMPDGKYKPTEKLLLGHHLVNKNDDCDDQWKKHHHIIIINNKQYLTRVCHAPNQIKSLIEFWITMNFKTNLIGVFFC